MFALYVVAVVCWVSVSSSAPLSCENLLQPLDKLDFDDVKGRWALVSASYSDPAYLEILKQKDSASVSFANYSASSELSFTRIYGQDESCQYMQRNVTLEGSGFSFPQSNVTMTLLQTSCPDCTVVRFDKLGKPQRFYLFSRRREVEPKEMEEFKAQVECLGMSAPALMDPTKQLCPAQVSRDSAPTEGQKA